MLNKSLTRNTEPKYYIQLMNYILGYQGFFFFFFENTTEMKDTACLKMKETGLAVSKLTSRNCSDLHGKEQVVSYCRTTPTKFFSAFSIINFVLI